MEGGGLQGGSSQVVEAERLLEDGVERPVRDLPVVAHRGLAVGDDEDGFVCPGQDGHCALAGGKQSVARDARFRLHHRADDFGDGDIRGRQSIPQIHRGCDARIHVIHRQPGVGEGGLHRLVNHLGDRDVWLWGVIRPPNAEDAHRLHFALDFDGK